MWKTFKSRIGTNNLWLTLYFIVLLIHFAFSAAIPLPQTDMRGGIDIVTRTATAVLAGYFISQSFIKKKPKLMLDQGENVRHTFQTVIVAVLGLFCLAVILIVRYVPYFEISISIVSQARDLYLGCVAFLMGTDNKALK